MRNEDLLLKCDLRSDGASLDAFFSSVSQQQDVEPIAVAVNDPSPKLPSPLLADRDIDSFLENGDGDVRTPSKIHEDECERLIFQGVKTGGGVCCELFAYLFIYT